MALKLFKLAISATTTTFANPNEYRYFYSRSTAINTTTISLSASRFSKDNGSAATTFQTVTSSTGYYMLYVNGELQQSGIYTVTSTALSLSGATIDVPANGVFALTVTKFAPSSSTTVVS